MILLESFQDLYSTSFSMVTSLILKKIEDRFILVVVCREGCPVDLFYYMECFFRGFLRMMVIKLNPVSV